MLYRRQRTSREQLHLHDVEGVHLKPVGKFALRVGLDEPSVYFAGKVPECFIHQGFIFDQRGHREGIGHRSSQTSVHFFVHC